jgi:hypothetical protein
MKQASGRQEHIQINMLNGLNGEKQPGLFQQTKTSTGT